MDQADNIPILRIARLFFLNALVGPSYVGLCVISLKLPQFPRNIIHPSESKVIKNLCFNRNFHSLKMREVNFMVDSEKGDM